MAGGLDAYGACICCERKSRGRLQTGLVNESVTWSIALVNLNYTSIQHNVNVMAQEFRWVPPKGSGANFLSLKSPSFWPQYKISSQSYIVSG